jgi:hypothetical protein
MDRRPLDVKLLVHTTALVANNQPIAVSGTVNIAMPNVWMAKTQLCTLLRRVVKEATELP